jgi:hypothetical protein
MAIELQSSAGIHPPPPPEPHNTCRDNRRAAIGRPLGANGLGQDDVPRSKPSPGNASATDRRRRGDRRKQRPSVPASSSCVLLDALLGLAGRRPLGRPSGTDRSGTDRTLCAVAAGLPTCGATSSLPPPRGVTPHHQAPRTYVVPVPDGSPCEHNDTDDSDEQGRNCLPFCGRNAALDRFSRSLGGNARLRGAVWHTGCSA